MFPFPSLANCSAVLFLWIMLSVPFLSPPPLQPTIKEEGLGDCIMLIMRLHHYFRGRSSFLEYSATFAAVVLGKNTAPLYLLLLETNLGQKKLWKCSWWSRALKNTRINVQEDLALLNKREKHMINGVYDGWAGSSRNWEERTDYTWIKRELGRQQISQYVELAPNCGYPMWTCEREGRGKRSFPFYFSLQPLWNNLAQWVFHSRRAIPLWELVSTLRS